MWFACKIGLPNQQAKEKFCGNTSKVAKFRKKQRRPDGPGGVWLSARLRRQPIAMTGAAVTQYSLLLVHVCKWTRPAMTAGHHINQLLPERGQGEQLRHQVAQGGIIFLDTELWQPGYGITQYGVRQCDTAASTCRPWFLWLPLFSAWSDDVRARMPNIQLF